MDILKSLLILFLVIISTSTQAKIGLDVKWKEKNSQIIPKSVCYNYSDSKREYRFCRIEAKSLFKKRCENYRKKPKLARKYKQPYKPKAKQKPHTQNKYCRVSRTFMIMK